MNEEFRRQNRQPCESLYDMPALRRVLMVGAIPELCGDLSELDQSLLTFGLDPLRIAGVPVVPPEEVEV